MEAAEMEVKEDSSRHPNPSSLNSLNRFGPKNSIQTNFGNHYVFHLASSDNLRSMAVSLSTNTIKLYSPMTGQYFGECRGHSSRIHHISFSSPSNPQILHSCSFDGTIRAWDIRTFMQVSLINDSQAIFSFLFDGSGDNLLTAGCNSGTGETRSKLHAWRNLIHKTLLRSRKSHNYTHPNIYKARKARSKLYSFWHAILCLTLMKFSIATASRLRTRFSKLYSEVKTERGLKQLQSVCHMDTSQWSHNHVACRALGIEAGSFHGCHFFSSGHFVWIPSPTST
ncbi:BURP domain [Dillenia turbinata]|uniref:BURP domain n=1 Tax=Dillenia turbinata TaxID=194707 RepID=A0AAN8YXI7_9MAGN